MSGHNVAAARLKTAGLAQFTSKLITSKLWCLELYSYVPFKTPAVFASQITADCNIDTNNSCSTVTKDISSKDFIYKLPYYSAREFIDAEKKKASESQQDKIEQQQAAETQEDFARYDDESEFALGESKLGGHADLPRKFKIPIP